jgi:hypothetical protein
MALEVIGAGWGRTGTESMKEALELLGFGRCYHMFELGKRTRQVPEWQKLFRGERPDYDELFRGFRSAVDFPACIFYQRFAEEYPDAKVVLTVRDPEAWWKSASSTILKGAPPGLRMAGRALGMFSPNVRGIPQLVDMLETDIYGSFLEGRARDREHMKARFAAWNEEVKRTIPSERLLVFDVKEGWEPLCAFLGRPIPETPFPRKNGGDSFAERTRTSSLMREFWRGADA